MEKWELILGVVSSIIGTGILTTLANNWFNKKRVDRETEAIGNTNKKALLDLKTEIAKELQGEFNDLIKEITEKNKVIVNLENEKSKVMIELDETRRKANLYKKDNAKFIALIPKLEEEVKKLTAKVEELRKGYCVEMKGGMCVNNVPIVAKTKKK